MDKTSKETTTTVSLRRQKRVPEWANENEKFILGSWLRRMK